MTDTSKATISAVVDMLNARRDQWAPDEQCREAASLISALEAELDEALSRLKEESREAFVGRKIVGQQKSLMLEAAAAINETLTRLEAAEAQVDALQAKLEKAAEALEPFAKHIDEMRFDRDNNGNELPNDQAVGWVYVTIGDFRRARSTLYTLRSTKS